MKSFHNKELRFQCSGFRGIPQLGILLKPENPVFLKNTNQVDSS